jgi:predicted Zn-dependent peptidase
MVIVGAVKVAQVKQLATQYLGPISAQRPPEKVRTIEPAQRGERRVYVEKASVSSPNIMMAYHVPATSNADYYALALLSDILSSGKSSRLHQQLVDKQIALDIATYLPQSFDPNLFYVYGVAAKDIDAVQLERALVYEVNRIIKDGVTEHELEKVKNQRLVSLYRTLATIDGKANEMGTYEVFFGDYKKLFNAPEDFSKVTIADIQRVAATYLVKRNRTIGVLAAQEDSHENDL